MGTNPKEQTRGLESKLGGLGLVRKQRLGEGAWEGGLNHQLD